MTKKQYAAYLQSQYWRDLRKETIEAQPECERCKLPRWLAELVYDQDLHVHHKTYANLGREEPEDLEVLCRRCHEVETFNRSDLPKIKRCVCSLCGSSHWDRRAELCSTCFNIFETPYLFHISSSGRPRVDDEQVSAYILKMLVFEPDIEGVKDRVKEFKRVMDQEARRLTKIFSSEIPF